MAFVQLMRYSTTRRAEIDDVRRQWLDDSEGSRTTRRWLIAEDRDNPGTYVEAIFFDSYEDAMHNSTLHATQRAAERIAALVDGEISYTNLRILEEGS